MKKKPPKDELEVPPIYLGEWLARWGIGSTEAGEIAGCDQSYISNMGAGRRENINVLYLLRLSQRIGVTVNDFYQQPPSQAQMDQLENYSPQARQALLSLKRRQA